MLSISFCQHFPFFHRFSKFSFNTTPPFIYEGLPWDNFRFCFRYESCSQELRACRAALNAVTGAQVGTVDHRRINSIRKTDASREAKRPAYRQAANNCFTASRDCLPSGRVPFAELGSPRLFGSSRRIKRGSSSVPMNQVGMSAGVPSGVEAGADDRGLGGGRADACHAPLGGALRSTPWGRAGLAEAIHLRPAEKAELTALKRRTSEAGFGRSEPR